MALGVREGTREIPFGVAQGRLSLRLKNGSVRDAAIIEMAVNVSE